MSLLCRSMSRALDRAVLRWTGAAAVAAMLSLAMACAALAQGNPPGWLPGVNAEPATPPAGSWKPAVPSKSRDADGQGGSTAVRRPPADGRGVRKSDGALGQVKLEALLTDDGQSIDQGIAWHVFAEKAEPDGKRRLLRTIKEARPIAQLPVGTYMVTASFGRAHLTRRITIGAGEAKSEPFVLNAGGLRVAATLQKGDAAQDRLVSYDILSDERDQSGQRQKIMSQAKPGLIIRLNAGLYHIVSTYGDANARLHADVAVEAGKLTEISVAHAGARVTLKLVTRAGGDALADAQWSIANAQGEVIKTTAGALPAHILAPGSYTVTASYSGRTYRREFKVQAGDVTHVELVIQQP